MSLSWLVTDLNHIGAYADVVVPNRDVLKRHSKLRNTHARRIITIEDLKFFREGFDKSLRYDIYAKISKKIVKDSGDEEIMKNIFR